MSAADPALAARGEAWIDTAGHAADEVVRTARAVLDAGFDPSGVRVVVDEVAHEDTSEMIRAAESVGVANLLAAIPITPGGLGVVEAVLTATLVGFGLDRGTAAIGVVTYRLAAFWLPIPLGALAYGSLKLGPGNLVRERERHLLRRLKEDTADVANVRKWDMDEHV